MHCTAGGLFIDVSRGKFFYSSPSSGTRKLTDLTMPILGENVASNGIFLNTL